jgi:putative Mg2+ transporter-C (MgtC) family protein
MEYLNIIWEELTFGLPDRQYLFHVLIRLIAAIVLGALIGLQREYAGKPAGLRTHTLVTLGTTVFILACSGSGMSADAVSRVIQGIITGIGFIGAGAILKLNEERDIKGLTTSASIWMAAAIGIAIGLGSLGLAILGTLFTLIILTLAGQQESPSDTENKKENPKEKPGQQIKDNK